MALAFADEAALEVVLRSGIVPSDALAGAARLARGAHDAIVLEPDRALAKPVLAKLRALGVTVDAALPHGARAIRCWAEAIAPRPASAGEAALVLFVVPRVADLLELAAELVRLGCDRVELLAAGDVGVARVVDPPTYTIVRALDRDGGLHAFAPDPRGQDRVWCELGARHPLAGELRAESGTLLLVARDGWRAIPDAGWLGLDRALELAVPGDDAKLTRGALPARRRVELRLSSGRRDAPSLWVIRANAVATIDRLLEYLPDDVVARLAFACSAGADPTVVLRVRTARHAPPELALPGVEAYAPLLDMPDIYAPVGAIVEPPLRRERLRAVLAIDNREVMWLARVGANDDRPSSAGANDDRPSSAGANDDRPSSASASAFRVERIADAAFAPLSEWVDYVLHASAPALEPWLRAATFDFAPFVSTGLEWASAPRDRDEPADEDAAARRRRGKPRDHVAPTAAAAAPAAVEPQPAAAQPAHAGESSSVAIDAQLAALEAEFVALDAPGDAPERLALLARLGDAYARLGRRRDAGLCFVRAVWESPPDDAAARLDAWLAGELAARTPAAALARALAPSIPDADDVRLVAMLAARRDPAVAADAHRVQRWLDDHDGELDARAMWLSRLGLAALAGGDALGLAHARDRVLSRLVGGLPVERELPAFLRVAGRSGALGASGDLLATALDDLARRFDTTKRNRSPLEAPPQLTHAYVQFLLAHGFARVGKPERARSLVDAARRALAPHAGDAVHAYLADAFAARVDQALAGVSAETALPDELGTRLAALDRAARYKVDRLRQASRILEPFERPDAMEAFITRHKDSRGPEFAALRELGDPRERARAVDALVTRATSEPAERERLVDGVLDVLLELPETAAMPIFARASQLVDHVAASRRAPLYAEALVVAGHFGRAELVPTLLAALADAMQSIAPDDVERVLHHSLRALRRIGLRDEIAELLAGAERALPAGTSPALLRGRLALAAGLAYLGDAKRALPIFETARRALAESLAPDARLALTRALALAYAQAPLADALAGIAELAGQLRDITDNYATNSHYCLSVLSFVESLVLGITSDDLALGEAGRRFVEDDEHLIRRRLHADLQGAT